MLILKNAHYLRSMQSGVSAFWNEALQILGIADCNFHDSAVELSVLASHQIQFRMGSCYMLSNLISSN